MKKSLTFFVINLLFIASVHAGGTEFGNPMPYPEDPCGGPFKIEYVKYVAQVGVQNCGDYVADFTQQPLGIITQIDGLKDVNIFYSILDQDPATGKSLSAVVKCDVATKRVSLLSLSFAAIKAYGNCGIPSKDL